MDWLILLTFVVSLLASVLSGMGGGGGGFIAVPYFLLIGLPPAQAIATAKMGGVGIAVGAITAFKGKGLIHRGLIYILMAITLVCALVAAWVIPKIESTLFENIIGVALILLVPTLFINKASLQPGERTKKWITIGYVLYILFCMLSALIATGMGSILILVLMFFFGLSALEANATKRVAQAVQSVFLFVFLAFQGLVAWTHGIASLIGCIIGSHIGGMIAIKKGSKFVKIALAITMVAAGLALLIW